MHWVVIGTVILLLVVNRFMKDNKLSRLLFWSVLIGGWLITWVPLLEYYAAGKKAHGLAECPHGPVGCALQVLRPGAR